MSNSASKSAASGGCQAPENSSSPDFRYEAKPSDVEAIRTLVASTDFFSAAEVDIAVELVQERLAKGDASEYFFVFTDDPDGRPTGYTCYGPIAGTVGSYDLYWIAVAPTAQGQGLGQRLLVETERLIAEQSGRHIYVETSSRAQYDPTRRFYERAGYDHAATLPDFYAPGDGKVFYVKRLA